MRERKVELKEVLIFAGTTEGRKLSECLAEAGIGHTICVATEYGEIVLEEHPLAKVRRGRMERKEIEKLLRKGNFAAIVDATHPFARDITRNIKEALEEIKIEGISVPCLRLKRDGTVQEEEDVSGFETDRACAEALEHTEGNILLTTGSKELSVYCFSEGMRKRLYVRVLPCIESLSFCMKQGICGKQVIAMQGPFSVEMNEAIIRQYKISHLVTKESGVSGGYQEKLEAAKRTGTRVFVIGRPREEGDSFSEVCNKLERILKKKIPGKGRMEIVLAGIGMGHGNCLTKEVEKAVREADILFGAERLLENIHPKSESYPFYQAGQIIPCLHDAQEKNLFPEKKKVVVLFSGDSGFYSGCQSLYAALEKEIREKRLKASLHVMPGISSVAYLAACIGESYHDAAVYSMHGKKLCNLARRIKSSPKTFLLTSGLSDIHWLGRLLIEADMPGCEVITGYQLSYEEQRIGRYTPIQCCGLEEEGLYTCFIRNPYAAGRKLTHGIRDDRFLRDRIPMTKEEVREVSICKLRLWEKSVVYDIGSGTGSVAVEVAGISADIQVYAIERKKEAVSFIEKNKEKFELENITVVQAEAPECFSYLPAVTHAFIGGSGGRLKEILAALKQKNPGMRVVINAVSMETICEIKEILSMYGITGEEVVQLQVSRVKRAGNYHLMRSENPVWICAFDFANENGREC